MRKTRVQAIQVSLRLQNLGQTVTRAMERTAKRAWLRRGSPSVALAKDSKCAIGLRAADRAARRKRGKSGSGKHRSASPSNSD